MKRALLRKTFEKDIPFPTFPYDPDSNALRESRAHPMAPLNMGRLDAMTGVSIERLRSLRTALFLATPPETTIS